MKYIKQLEIYFQHGKCHPEWPSLAKWLSGRKFSPPIRNAEEPHLQMAVRFTWGIHQEDKSARSESWKDLEGMERLRRVIACGDYVDTESQKEVRNRPKWCESQGTKTAWQSKWYSLAGVGWLFPVAIKSCRFYSYATWLIHTHLNTPKVLNNITGLF